MEFIFELIFELFGEVIIQIVMEALAEVGFHMFQNSDSERKPSPPWRLALIYIFFGLLAGGLSLLVLPNSFMHSQLGKIVCLALTPIAAGLAMMLIGAWRQKRGQQVVELDRFAYGYIFALAAALVRYQWA
jgi:hypothetical protein